MATAVIMPRQGQSVESCVIGEWFKKVGDDVGEGELLFSYETDKAVFEEAAKVSGKLLAVFFGVGDDVPCLETVAVIGAEGEDISGVAPKVEAEPEQREEAPAEAAAPAASLQTAERARGISPRAKNAAERLRLDPAMAAPTGPNGRVIERDIAALAAESRTGSGLGGRLLPCDMETAKRQVEELTPAAPAEEYEDVKLTNIRKVIAKSMHQSLSEMAQLTHTVSFDATCIMNYRKQLKRAAEKLGETGITATGLRNMVNSGNIYLSGASRDSKSYGYRLTLTVVSTAPANITAIANAMASAYADEINDLLGTSSLQVLDEAQGYGMENSINLKLYLVQIAAA